jgi:alpha-tubulin suppressor-like RCC1 family protein
MISCGAYHSMVLTKRGQVFSWGYNNCGQLGHRNKNYLTAPKIINLKRISIKKISCGHSHSLLLSNDGVIYACGSNGFDLSGTLKCEGNSIYLENQKMENQFSPFKLNHKNVFSDIATHPSSDISVSLSHDSKY